MATKTPKPKRVYQSIDGKSIQPGPYLDSIGQVIDVRQRKNGSFEYKDRFVPNYVPLGAYAKMLLGRIRDPRAAIQVLEQYAQSLPLCTNPGSYLEFYDAVMQQSIETGSQRRPTIAQSSPSRIPEPAISALLALASALRSI